MRFSVDTPTEQAVAFMAAADFGVLSNWDPFVRLATVEAGEPLTLGAVYHLDTKAGIQLVYEITQVDVPRSVTYRGGSRRVKSTDTITVDETATGSRVTIESTLSFSGWTVVAAPLILALVWLGGRFISLPALKRHVDRAS